MDRKFLGFIVNTNLVITVPRMNSGTSCWMRGMKSFVAAPHRSLSVHALKCVTVRRCFSLKNNCLTGTKIVHNGALARRETERKTHALSGLQSVID
ncbi:hypothetical protein Pan161_24690 [Gimesia algae]|uniref:Uncharacterized protein n=1 Tax=Gimesia algae TaxID=2527971 RepID=A0A517VCS9_9PLAN|nr:hypothetical protein Pan161_24690 [Gimesia algae]